ncbi:MAG: uracil phosphoribosyltransferase [Candidatus Bipolaricaulota bacterium]|nr:uracil phosphoribosyltransferase [Candidatus Bipolaricaulota bacterium]MBS3792295.1 uracil phosphoribosyltransferase [Candidatus Bipolaricaulota bacterium]
MEGQNLNVVRHPLIQNKLTYLRNKNTDNQDFRLILEELTTLMVYEITRNYPLAETEVETPLEKTTSKMLDTKVALVPILRAGVGMLEGVLNLLPKAKVGHIGLYRDHETLEPVEYYKKLPQPLNEFQIIVVDPMLATGGTAKAGVELVKEEGGENVQFLCLVAAPEGVENFSEKHPNVPVYTAAVDDRLDEEGYIHPGLGDAGDRLFGT